MLIDGSYNPSTTKAAVAAAAAGKEAYFSMWSHSALPARSERLYGHGWVNPNKGRADRPMTPPTHTASSMCFAPASEVLDPPPDTSGEDVKGLI